MFPAVHAAHPIPEVYAITNTLFTSITSLCLVGHRSIQCFSFNIFTNSRLRIHLLATETFLRNMLMPGVDPHQQEREQHEEGHQVRHGCQFVDWIHSSS